MFGNSAAVAFGDVFMDLEKFFSQLSNSPSAAFRSRQYTRPSALPEEIRQAAARGLKLFPVSLPAKLTGCPNLLICEATCDLSRLEELSVTAQPLWGYRVAVGPSGLCVWHVGGPVGRASFASLVPDLDECFTLQVRRGDSAWAFYRWPKGLVLRTSARKLASGVSIIGESDSCIVPPSGGAVWENLCAEIEALPHSLRELAFETMDTPPGCLAPSPTPSPRLLPCRSVAHFEKPHRGTRKSYPIHGQAGCREGYRISRRR